MVDISLNLSVITLNVNDLSVAIRRQIGRVNLKNDSTLCYLQKLSSFITIYTG